MTHRLHRILLAIFALILLAPSVSARERDPLAIINDMSAEPLEVIPQSLILKKDRDTITRFVTESRNSGVPLAVRVISWPTDYSVLSAFPKGSSTEPLSVTQMHDMARAWMASQPIESSPGAQDGILVFAVVPENTKLSTVVIEYGANALPLNGLSEASIANVVTNVIRPSFAEGHIGAGLIAGVSRLGYDNLFAVPERHSINSLHQDLQTVAGVPMAALTALSALALWTLMGWIHRRNRTDTPVTDAPMSLTPTAAAALTNGRVDDAVSAGGLLSLVDEGTLEPGDRYRLHATHPHDDPFLDDLVEMLRLESDANGNVSNAAIARIHDVTRGPRENLEDALARGGYFNRDGKSEMMWLLLGSFAVAALAAVSLMPSLFGTARFGVFAITFAAITVFCAITWGVRRSWTTDRGRVAVTDWLKHATPADRIRYERMVHQDRFITNTEGWNVPPRIRLARTLRGLGSA